MPRNLKRYAGGAEDIDMLVVHIPPLEIWYVLPVTVFAPHIKIRLHPNIRVRSRRWERYREAWGLFTGKSPKQYLG
jgi:hypothetical protein